MPLDVRTADTASDVRHLLESAGDVSIAVAFVTATGINEIRAQLVSKLESGYMVRMLIDLQDAATDPSALWDLLAVADDNESRLKLRALLPETGILHTKLYIGHGDADSVVVTGSANLTAAAFYRNIEHGVRIAGTLDDSVLREATSRFDELWASDKAFDIDEEAARLYETYCGRRRAVADRARRRSRAAWNDLARHLAEGPPAKFEWPSPGTAYIIGAIAARGFLEPAERRIRIPLLFRPQSYTGQRIAVQSVSFEAATVLPVIPHTIAAAAQRGFPGTRVRVQGQTVTIDFRSVPAMLDEVEGVFAPSLNCNDFRLPRGLTAASDGVVTEFLSGFAAASALLTDNTSLPKNPRTGLPGLMTVWLRPKKANELIYDDLYELITRRLGLTVYRHQRVDREPHLKIRCDDFAEVGFGISWWDELVQSGAEYNQSHFAQPLPLPFFE